MEEYIKPRAISLSREKRRKMATKKEPKMENPGETVEEYKRGLKEKKRWFKNKGGE
jgi:hypothetical protein